MCNHCNHLRLYSTSLSYVINFSLLVDTNLKLFLFKPFNTLHTFRMDQPVSILQFNAKIKVQWKNLYYRKPLTLIVLQEYVILLHVSSPQLLFFTELRSISSLQLHLLLWLVSMYSSSLCKSSWLQRYCQNINR